MGEALADPQEVEVDSEAAEEAVAVAVEDSAVAAASAEAAVEVAEDGVVSAEETDSKPSKIPPFCSPTRSFPRGGYVFNIHAVRKWRYEEILIFCLSILDGRT